MPVALNSGLFWPRRAFIRRPGTVVVEILEPIEPGLDKQTFLALLRERIEAVSDRLLDEALAQDPTLPGRDQAIQRHGRRHAALVAGIEDRPVQQAALVMDAHQIVRVRPRRRR